MKVLSVFGTRPEAIKMCPLIKEMEKNPEIDSVVCLTGQHKEMLKQVIDIFDINVTYNLDIMKAGQTLTTITADILSGLEKVLQKEVPDIVLVHGDTTTSFAAALAAFYQKIPVGHVEAGLRTYDKYSPYPEEMNRNLTSKIATLHFAPTEANRNNLFAEGISASNIYVTGNTVIDALQTTVIEDYKFKSEQLRSICLKHMKCILVTAHRRENLGKRLENVCNAILRLTQEEENVIVIYPVHLNPVVRNVVFQKLGHQSRIYLIDPLDVEDMHNLMARSYLIMTDSGGIQEEAPAFGVPVMVLRNESERMEAVKAGTVKLVGTEEENILCVAKNLLHDQKEYGKMAQAMNPYGDGHASRRIVNIMLDWYKSPANKYQ